MMFGRTLLTLATAAGTVAAFSAGGAGRALLALATAGGTVAAFPDDACGVMVYRGSRLTENAYCVLPASIDSSDLER